MRLIIDRRVLAGFRRRALSKYPREHLEIAVGRLNGSTVEIHAFADVDHTSTRNEVCYSPTALAETHEEVEEMNLVPLGTIHSHPDTKSCHPSETDWDSALEDNEMVMGVLAIWKTGAGLRSRLRWWPSVKPVMQEIK